MNIAEILLQRAAELGGNAAIVDVHRDHVHRNFDRCYSFRELDAATASVADQMRSAGLKPGDGVLLLHPVSAELYVVLIALFRLGCVAIFLDPSAGRAHVERCCAIFPPKAFFGSPRALLLRWTIPALRRVPKAFCFSWFPGSQRLELRTNADTTISPEVFPVAVEAPALITFTSGSTGQPKAALRTHAFLLAQHRALEASLALQPGKRDLTTLPIFLLANLASGVTSILPDADLRSPGKIRARPVLVQIERHKIETTAASPAFISRLLDECERSGITMPSLSSVYMGGEPVFPGLLRKAKQFCPHARITAVYGSTEAEPMAEVALSDISKEGFEAMEQGKGLLTGRPVSSISLRVIREQWGIPFSPLDVRTFEHLAMADGDPGEIVVSGEHVLPGYLNGEGDSETKFDVDGVRWHRTGDLGYMDSSGRLWLLGRCKGKIQDARGSLYPFAVECAAMQTAAIRRAALAAVDGRRLLAIESTEALSRDVILRSLSWAQLDDVVFLDHVPVDKRHNAKVDYIALFRELKRANHRRRTLR
jgi:acyl-CoA synthetase (AMP-forming)/AMP-acid ligase II